MAFSLDSKVKDILKNPEASAVLDKYSPDAVSYTHLVSSAPILTRKLKICRRTVLVSVPA